MKRRARAKDDKPNNWQYLRAAMGMFVLFYVGTTILLVFLALLLKATGLATASDEVADFYDRWWLHRPQWLFLIWCILVILWLNLRHRAKPAQAEDDQ
tara:strand:- start:718 stop:1011 length:294 start_codon:yes stop_codon:yes gene_type:complete